MIVLRRWFGAWLSRNDGTAAVEFAIVGPLFLVLLSGIISYGGYFWLAHALQQIANDAARVAVAGLDANERQTLAQGVLQNEMTSYAYLNAKAAKVSVNSQPQSLTVQISYDASGSPFWALTKLVPMPATTIQRSAVIQLGGY
ncbi:pilus assembly protein [Caulobacter sp. CCUG 60055]|uniref:TadE/TadG family type IV pilus assembly protein n=1 Tax=Caulobacter sp. CCUG 60055 TaxID=2100090 RepID=UPI0024189CE8|nr:TadE/TadG family type IV pilus assembly protein [Caulobacter sp. CCUG 60055]MCI3182279.1 pilus assembly protein [Caulobacter sp. CCUG 60055]